MAISQLPLQRLEPQSCDVYNAPTHYNQEQDHCIIYPIHSIICYIYHDDPYKIRFAIKIQILENALYPVKNKKHSKCYSSNQLNFLLHFFFLPKMYSFSPPPPPKILLHLKILFKTFCNIQAY